MNNLFLKIVDDKETNQAIKQKNHDWKVAIIDDDKSVHDATKLALSGIQIQGGNLEFISAFSGEEGFQLLKKHSDCAVVLLDVVMESPKAGLELAYRIRQELRLENIQIIIRAGQPSYVIEEDIISQYKINDYKTKNELTRDKLFITIATAIRSFKHLSVLNESRKGLRKVIKASASLMKERSLHEFSNGVLQQINVLFNLDSLGIIVVSQQPLKGSYAFNKNEIIVYQAIAVTEKYKKNFGKTIEEFTPDINRQVMKKALLLKRHVIEDNVTVLYFETPSLWNGIIMIEGVLLLKEIDKEILKIFCLNIALGLENAKYFSQINHDAYYDSLTGLYNRTGFLEYSKELLKQTINTLTVFVIDIDFFHDINESHGFDYGNGILGAVSATLKTIFPRPGVIARIYTDVFAIALADTQWQLKTLIQALSVPFVVENNPIRLGLTMGASSCKVSQKKIDIDLLLCHAKIALKEAKENNRGAGQEFQPEDEKKAINRRSILSELRIGILNNELFLMLQPKVSISKKQIVGYEALIRWDHPTKGLIPPNDFIPIAEKSGIYFDIDMYVFRKTLDIIEKYPQITHPISVNISVNSLHHINFVDELKNIMLETKIDIHRIELEVTEHAIVRSEMAIKHLKALRKMGFVLCLDDFGSGYSSLCYLLKLPLDVIKIDSTFVNSITDNPDALAVLKGMLQICQDLNKKVVVEGVETQQQIDLLIQLNIDVIQGFFYYKPMRIDDVIEVLGGRSRNGQIVYIK
ncbi:MAG: EAL domain-containing protein [Methylococcales bacterium]|nr:EAL domain-containing protein [Methylococcales bacterium]